MMNAAEEQKLIAAAKPAWKRVYFVGAHSTGKTTLATWVADAYKVPMIPEVARTIMREWGSSLDRIRMNPATADRFQVMIFNRQLMAEDGFERFVSDRACDHLAYAAEHSRVAAAIIHDPRMTHYMRRMAESIVFFIRPHRDLIVADGVRAALDWESVVRIDAMAKFILKIFDVPYIELASRDMHDRIQTVAAVLGKAGA